MIHLHEEGFQVFVEGGGERRGQESPLNFSVILAIQGKIQQVIFGDELVEHTRRQHDSRRHRDANTGKAARHAAFSQ